MIKLAKLLIKAPFNFINLIKGLSRVRNGQFINESIYSSLIELFCLTGGWSNTYFSSLITRNVPVQDFKPQKANLLKINPQNLTKINTALINQGYYILPEKLPSALCDELVAFALKTNTKYFIKGENNKSVSQIGLYDRKNPISPRYLFNIKDLSNNKIVQDLMANRSIISIVQNYLGAQPMLDAVSMWWSTNFKKEADSEAAQLFHFDMERLKWLKVFVYLTEVTKDSGPHVFVKGSHQDSGIPLALRKKGYKRLSDELISKYYKQEDIKEFIAPKGTILIEDTRGLHKGKNLLKGDRLLLQLQFSNGNFGMELPTCKIEEYKSTALKEMVHTYPKTYANFQ